MHFEEGKFYKHIYRDPDMAFAVDQVLSKNSARGVDMIVTWYKKTDNNKYITINVSGEFHVPKDNIMYYLEI